MGDGYTRTELLDAAEKLGPTALLVVARILAAIERRRRP